MDYLKNLKYYNSKDTHFYIGFVILILGGVLFALGQFFYAWFIPYQTTVGIIIAIGGALLAFVPRSMRSSGKDIDEAVASMTNDYAKNAAENIGITHMLMKNKKLATLGTFTYDGENTLVRRSKTDAKYRSNAYTVSAILFTKAGIFVPQKSFSLTDDRVNETVSDFVYADLANATVESLEHTFADSHKKKLFYITITANDGKTLRIPAEQSAALDRICEEINEQIRNAKKA